MKTSKPRWGEVTVKQQGEKKNRFDQTKSFSVDSTEKDYSIEEYVELLKLVTNLTQFYDFATLKQKI